MTRNVSLTLSFLLLVGMVIPLDSHFLGGILQPDAVFAQDGPLLEEFVLYSQKKIKLDNIGESAGNVGSNGSIEIKKSASGSLIGSLQALDRLKNEAEIGIYGDVTARVIEDKGVLSVSGQKLESGDLIPQILPVLSYSASGPDLEVPESSSETLAPDSYGHLKVKKGAALNLSNGEYYFVKFEVDESAAVILDASGGAIYINVVDKIKFKKDVDLQIVGGGPQDVRINFMGAGKVEVGDRSVLRGIFTAPMAEVEFKKGSRLQGAVYADSIHLAKDASFRHYRAIPAGRPPTADAGSYQTVPAGGSVELDGSGSSDPDGDAITYHWSFLSFPAGSNPSFTDPADPRPTFNADLPGVYVIELAVYDGGYASLRDSATVTAVSELADVTDFVLYADDKIKIDEISGGVGHVGANRHIHIEKGTCGPITGDLHALDHIKNSAQITIDGNVYANSKVDDHGGLTVTGTVNENAQLATRKLPSISFSAAGPDLEVPASTEQTLAPGSFGRVAVKKGATLHLAAGSYFLRELKADDSAILNCEASAGPIELNVVKKLEFGKNAVVQITGGDTRDVSLNYVGKKDVKIGDRGVLRGTLVAPGAKIEFKKDARFQGAVYAKRIYLDKGVSFQFHEPEAVNTPPLADPAAITAVEDTPAALTLSGSDPDGDSLAYTVVSQPLHGTLAGSAPDLTYTPDKDYHGPDAFSFTVNDGTIDSDPATVNITVGAVNDPPVAISQTISLNEDEAQAVVLSGHDSEGDALAYEIVGQPANGTLSGTAPDLIYTPGENYHGADAFSFTVNDGTADSDPAMVNITVAAVNDPPVAGAGPDRDVLVFDTVTLNGSGSTDVDGDNLTYEWAFVSRPAASSAALSYPGIGTAVFLADTPGSYEIQLIVNDGTTKSTSDSVVITADFAPFSALEAKMTASDAEAGDGLGKAVAIDGDTAIAGTGSAYIYKYDGSDWDEQAKLTAADEQPEDHFGAAVSISGDMALVGAYGNDDDGADSGAAYIFTFDGAAWTERAKLTADDAAAGDYFGTAVAIGQDRVVVGADGDDDSGTDSGSAYIFVFDGAAWIRQAKLTANDAEAGDGFGVSTSMNANGVMIGAAGDDNSGADAGAAYFFRLVNSDWIQQDKLVADDGASGDGFGASLAVSDSYAVVGAAGADVSGEDAGAAYIFAYKGFAWTQVAKLSASDAQPGDRFGAAVAISGNYAAVGAPGSDDGGQDAGAVYLFKFDGTSWTQQAKMIAADSHSGDVFGAAVAMDGASVFAGASGNDEGGQEAGAIYVFSIESYHTVSLRAEPGTVALGGASTLVWDSINVSAASLGPGLGEVPPDGSTLVSPTETTTYTITATGPYGSISDEAAILVYEPSVSVTVNASAEPADLQPGQASTLTWHTTNAVSCIIEPGIGPVDLNGSITVSPKETTIYTITAANPAGATTGTVTVAVNYPLPAVSISAQPGTINFGESATLTWSSNDAGSVSIDQGIGDVEHNGSITLSPIETTTYTITAAGPGGTASETVTITVIPRLSSSEFKVTAGDEAAVLFGFAVSISGDYAIVGDNSQDDDTGSAYLFKREGSGWLQQVKLFAGDAAQGDYFGESVSISGDYAIVGACRNDDSAGSAYIFRREGSDWLQQAKLVADDAAQYDNFGRSVAIRGDYAIVGANADDDYTGAAYIFKRDGVNWTQQAKLTAEDAAAYDEFGTAVSISGDYAIVGASSKDDFSGSAYIFRREGTSWLQQAKFIAGVAAAYGEFGFAVSINGDYAIVGAYQEDDSAGAAYIFKRDGSNWTQQARLTADDAAARDKFGRAVSISGNYAIVGASGDENNTGATYTFKRDGSSWRQRDKLTAADAAEYDDYGHSVSINGAYIVVSAPFKYDDDPGDFGSVYFYALPTPTVTIGANPGIIQIGGSATLAWTSEDAASCVIEPGVGDVALEGTTVVQPTETTTYTIKATGAEAPATDTVTVYVYDPAAPITLNATADPANIQPGQSTTLTWNTANATSCVIEPGIGPVDLAGAMAVSPSETTSYTISAANPTGTVTKLVTVPVNSPPSITIFQPDGEDDIADSSYTIIWTDHDPDDDAVISLYYATDRSGTNGTLIVSGLSEDPDGAGQDSYQWNTSGIAGGSYYVYAEIHDGINAPVRDYSDGALTINHSLGIKLVAGDGQYLDMFGDRVELSGNYAIVGAPRADVVGMDSGAAYVFYFDGLTWSRQTRVVPADAAQGQYFASAVAVNDEYAVVGQSGDKHAGSWSGSVYIFERDGSNWSQQAKIWLDDAEPYEYFGDAVGISGDYLIVGAEGDKDNGNYSGAAYIYKRTGSNWYLQAKLAANDPVAGDRFGDAVAIDGDFVIVGAYNKDTFFSNSGAAYIFKRDGASWIQQAKLFPNDPGSGDSFGRSVSISGQYAIVGMHGKNSPYHWAGAAYIYKRNGSQWTYEAKLTPDDPAMDKHFGASVSIDGDYAVVGAYGDTHAGDYTGAVYLFKREGSIWVQIDKLTAGDAAAGDYLGYSAALSSDRLVAGAFSADTHVDDTGAAYIFKFPAAVVDISADPTVIALGGSASLTWSSRNVDTVSIEPGTGEYDVNGSISVSPAQTTTYIITGTGPEGEDTDRVTVSVYDPLMPVSIASFTAAPDDIQAGESSTLTWNSTNATSCVIEPGIGSVEVEGSIKIKPDATTTYTIIAANPAGSIDKTVTVVVTYPPPTVNINADPATIVLGESSTLAWQTADATACFIEPGVGTVDINGTIPVSPTQTTTYSITTTGPGGSTTETVTITVTYPLPVANIRADPPSIREGDSATLIWDVSHAETVAIDQGIGSVATTGSREVFPAATTTYTLEANGRGGTTSARVTIEVQPQVRTRIRYQYDSAGRIIKVIREQLP